MAKRSEKRVQFLLDVLTTACEGGIGYWSFLLRYDIWENPEANWQDLKQKRDPQLQLFDYAGADSSLDLSDFDPNAWSWKEIDWHRLPHQHCYTLNIDAIARGLQLAWDAGRHDNHDSYWYQLYLADKTNGDDGDYDAGLADQVVQYGLLGEDPYG